ncbi:hypothetical protein V5O48_010055 [Marasmius crinis-equi]|uniref:Gamma-butyrobetaine dioxygenase n=1 Tax=Marasmius crinis-equi TaxID=585013 RepID=A0ABR3F9T4_9AGAR
MSISPRIPHTLARSYRKYLPRSRLQTRKWTSFTMGDNALTIDAFGASFPYVWLRDSCQSRESVHPATTQKLHQTSDIPLEIQPIAVKLVEEKGIAIEWEDGHRSYFDKEFLKRHSSPESLNEFHKDLPQRAWNKDQVASSDLFLGYEDVKTPLGLLKAMNQLCQYGLLFVRGVANKETDNAICELRHLASLFSDIRPTFYGELWDVQNKNSENIAYTNLNLGFHMDLLYFANPPRYQVLHCLRNRVEGGTSVFVDALNVAYHLQAASPSEFHVLTKTPVPFQYVYGETHYHQTHPTIQLSSTGETIKHINYSPPFQAPLLLSTPPEFYNALKTFDRGLQDPQNMYRYTLLEGDAVFFDNRRVLHARTGFTDRSQGQGGVSRWLKGCYFEGDKMWDKARLLRTQEHNSDRVQT